MANLFEHQYSNDVCLCGSPACNDFLRYENLINPDTSARVLVESDIYEDAVLPDGSKEQRIKWRRGEFITEQEADRLGMRDVPFIVRLNKERVTLEQALGVVNVQSMGENKAYKPGEDKSERPVEDKGDKPEPNDDKKE